MQSVPFIDSKLYLYYDNVSVSPENALKMGDEDLDSRKYPPTPYIHPTPTLQAVD